MPRKLEDAVVVITGASSGIGATTARAMARRRPRLALAARGETALEDVRSDCAACGADAIAIPTDVSSEGAVAELARQAVERFGRIDVWVNNAGVMLYGRLEDTPAMSVAKSSRRTCSARSTGRAPRYRSSDDRPPRRR